MACPLTRVPCASRDFEHSPNSQNLLHLRFANPARQAGSLYLKIPAVLGSAYGTGVGGFDPVGAAEHHRQDCEAGLYIQMILQSTIGPLFFWFIFFGGAKINSPGANWDIQWMARRANSRDGLRINELARGAKQGK